MRLLLLTGLFLTALLSSITAQVETIAVNPSQTDPQIQPVHGEHTAYIDRAAPPVNKLLLMIVGTGAAANHNIPFCRFAASMGYHVICIDYKNTVITTVCSNSKDSACFNEFRQEIIFGEPVSPLVEVDSANSIYHRVYALLLYLSGKFPEQGWQQYTKGKSIQWPKIIVAGHSQGAGHAAYLGKKFPVNRVLIFAGPQDFLVQFNKPAGWVFQKSITSPSKYFAFLHLQDPFDFKKQLAGCMALLQSVKADTVFVQPLRPVIKSGHILVTNIETTNAHESMMQPVFEQALAWLLAANPGH